MLTICKQTGFTLIELLVVLAILGLALALVPPLFTHVIKSAEVKNATRELAAGLRAARDQAVILQSETTFLVDVKHDSYTVNKTRKTLDLPAAARLSLTTARSEQQSATAGTIRFFPDGSSTGGRVALQAGKNKYDINVNWLTGQVSISP